jgi:hypothetical protein
MPSQSPVNGNKMGGIEEKEKKRETNKKTKAGNGDERCEQGQHLDFSSKDEGFYERSRSRGCGATSNRVEDRVHDHAGVVIDDG